MLTLTGLDAPTWLALANRRRIREMQTVFNVEFGVLYSAHPNMAVKDSSDQRYPSLQVIENILEENSNIALHVCGSLGRTQLFRGELDHLVKMASRVQINGRFDYFSLEKLCQRAPDVTFITQWNTMSQDTFRISGLPRHELLVDASGGRGQLPSVWPLLHTRQITGFAGGLGPENLRSQLERLMPVAQPGWWVDMETNIRTNGVLDLDKCGICITEVESFLYDCAKNPLFREPRAAKNSARSV